MERSWPLIQRQREFDAITDALTSETGACGVLLTGAPGVGKTTLARVATQSVPGELYWVAGTESARGIPMGAFAHLVGGAPSSDPVAFLSAVRARLLHPGDRVVLGVDDAHLLDQLSATFLHQLAIDRVARIVATVRSGESTPDAVTSLWKDGYLRRLELAPFTRAQSVGLVESALGGPLEGLSADRMWEASGGNALFLRHLVEGALEAGTLRQRRGVWQLRGRAAITSELALLLEGRIEQLPPDVLGALQLLAFCEPLDLDTLAGLDGEEAVEEAERRGLVRIVEDGPGPQVRYAHPLFGEVVRGRVGRVAARRLRGSLVAALRTGALAGPAARIRLAELALDSDRDLDLELLVAAAKDAVGLGDVSLGERLARAAVERGGGFEAAQLLAFALLWQGHAAEAEQLLGRFDPDRLDQRQLVRWGVTRVVNLIWSSGNTAKAGEVLEAVRRRVDHPGLALVVRGLGAACAVTENRLEEGLADVQAVLADPNASPWAVEWATYAGGVALAFVGRGSEVAALSTRADAVMDKVDGLTRCAAAMGFVRALTLTGDFDAAARRAQKYLDDCTAGQYLAWGLANILVAVVELARGRFTDAARRLEQAIAALNVGDTADVIAWSFPAYPILAQAYSVLGRVDDAAASAAAAGQYGIEAVALHLATRFGDASTAPRLAELAQRCDGKLVPLAAAQAAAFAAGDGDGLSTVAVEFEKLGALLDAADASAQAAVAYSTSGRTREALDAAATANSLAEQCDHASTPAVVAAAHPLPLTRREREVASMVAVGLSNREIADRLVVSVRTVEGHIYRACTKLGLPDRGALAASLRASRAHHDPKRLDNSGREG